MRAVPDTFGGTFGVTARGVIGKTPTLASGA